MRCPCLYDSYFSFLLEMIAIQFYYATNLTLPIITQWPEWLLIKATPLYCLIYLRFDCAHSIDDYLRLMIMNHTLSSEPESVTCTVCSDLN